MDALYRKFHEWIKPRSNKKLYCLGTAICFLLGLLCDSIGLLLIAILLAILFVVTLWNATSYDEKTALEAQVATANQEMRSFFQEGKFVEPMKGAHWRNKHAELIDAVARQYHPTRAYHEVFDTFINFETNFDKDAHEWNETLAAEMAPSVLDAIGDVEERALDAQQLACIAKDVHNSLVIAGAGTGKTTTVIGKIKYLLKTKQYKPEDFLVLSFTNASASEMSERIAVETGEAIDVHTFHKLGLNIITTVEGIKPKIADINMRKFVKEAIAENMRQPWYATLMTSYLLFHHTGEESEWNFESEQEYHEYLRFNPPCTMKQETVKSYGEVDIANFLYMNGIEYIYERPYPVDTRTSEYGEYKPDFYLPEYDIYIEYFGIDSNGKVPSYFTGKNGMSPEETYQEGMRWKRQLHAKCGSTLIECYAWEQFSGCLVEELQRKLEEADVTLSPVSAEDIWAEMTEENEAILDGVLQLFETVITLMKSNRYTIQDVKQLATKSKRHKDINILLRLIESIANKYDETLAKQGSIDFNDMINKATDYVTSGKYQNPYKYVIVDEYQDISKARFMLLKALRKSRFYDLFCVGDDWQSIYRFAGSDISFILEFEKYWGPAETSKIETTYRFSQTLSEISGRFIMKNPAQVKKRIKGIPSSTKVVVHELYGTSACNMIEQLLSALKQLPQKSTVYFIGRYNSDIKMFENDERVDYHYSTADGGVVVTFKERRDLKIEFMSAHKSKGLQADYVFIINNKNTRMGFPSRIQDAPILSLLLGTTDTYPFAEERRLFYVALTRARTKVFLCTIKRQESMFVFDVLQQPICPNCGGRMFIRKGEWGEFWGCENYSNGCRAKKNIQNKPRNQ